MRTVGSTEGTVLLAVEAEPDYPFDAEVSLPDGAGRLIWQPREAIWALAGMGLLLAVLVILPVADAAVAVAATMTANVALVVIAVAAAWPAVQRSGGSWQRAVGLARPAPRELLTALGWVLVQFICRFLVATVLVQMLPGLHGHGVSNLTGVRVMHGVDLALLVVAAVVLAPPAEELLFRGVLLRVLTVRTGFWAAAFISSVLFGVAHAHEEHAVLTGVVLAVLTGLFGVLQCVLVRRTGRLFPAILTHSMMNGAAISLVFALH